MLVVHPRCSVQIDVRRVRIQVIGVKQYEEICLVQAVCNVARLVVKVPSQGPPVLQVLVRLAGDTAAVGDPLSVDPISIRSVVSNCSTCRASYLRVEVDFIYSTSSIGVRSFVSSRSKDDVLSSEAEDDFSKIGGLSEGSSGCVHLSQEKRN